MCGFIPMPMISYLMDAAMAWFFMVLKLYVWLYPYAHDFISDGGSDGMNVYCVQKNCVCCYSLCPWSGGCSDGVNLYCVCCSLSMPWSSVYNAGVNLYMSNSLFLCPWFPGKKTIEGLVFNSYNLCVIIPWFLGKKSIKGLIFMFL